MKLESKQFDYSAIRKAQNKVKVKYNRLAKQFEKVGLTAEEDGAIEKILRPKFEKELQDAAAGASSEPAMV